MINRVGVKGTKSKTIVSALLFAVVVTIGFIWTEHRGRMYSLQYTPESKHEFKIPAQVPFAEMKVTDVSVGEDQQEAAISLLNADKNIMDIRITSSKPEYAADKVNRVKIGEDMNGDFIPDDSGRRVLPGRMNGTTK
ncbi:hypothetical protein JI667_07385 [Bacillus sp. NTK074B]|uniref:hypothetical protein n=1 Tax=Bacillus sp. NTK074B TaxID=2802174 RepID=UPI001A9000A2|nr:hypothetical protein [Bacillus sp. NTK074B]